MRAGSCDIPLLVYLVGLLLVSWMHAGSCDIPLLVYLVGLLLVSWPDRLALPLPYRGRSKLELTRYGTDWVSGKGVKPPL
jgi:hypothetical protein